MERIMPSSEEISDLCSLILGVKVVRIEPTKPGAQGKAYRLSTGSKEYVFKTSNQNYLHEGAVIELLAREGLPVAKVVATDANVPGQPYRFSLLEAVKGASLSSLPKNEWPDVLIEVGTQLNKMHHISTRLFGPINESVFMDKGVLQGVFPTWADYLANYIINDLKALKSKIESEKKNNFRNPKINDEQLDGIVEILAKSGEVERRLHEGLDDFTFEPKLLYRDLHSEHIFAEDGKLSGLIDFAAVASGDPLFDIAYFSVMPGGEFYKYLCEGWNGEFNEERFHLYRLLLSVEKIHTRYVEGDYLDKYPEVIDHALVELHR